MTTTTTTTTTTAATLLPIDAVSLDLTALSQQLGAGPMRFAPPAGERTIEEQIAALTPAEKQCFDTLKEKWQAHVVQHAQQQDDKKTKKNKNKKTQHDEESKPGVIMMYSDAMILRFARCSPGVQKFNPKTAWSVMKKFDATRYLNLRVTTGDLLEAQLRSQTLFCVPGLQSKDGGHDVFYMRPSRYVPSETSTQTIIDNLAYCMQCLVERSEKACVEGIAFLANLTDWTMHNFSVNYCWEFMKMLQGRTPVRVRLFLIVNPPAWFGVIWKIMKPMLAADFRKKVHMISADQLSDFLMPNFEAVLCDDMTGVGQANTKEMIDDFIAYRKAIEEQKEKEMMMIKDEANKETDSCHEAEVKA
ncbi:hypothetical protein ACA910_001571 [Epithemia clementina (nom. ined.)]